MKIKSNVHTHTQFCDGKEDMESLVVAAMAKGFTTLGFSPHSFTPFDTSYCMKDFAAFKAEFDRLKAKYGGKINLLCGVELDAFGQKPDGLDFVITSAHYVLKDGVYYEVDGSEEKFARGCEALGGRLAFAKSYYDVLCDAVLRTSPDIIGHFDLVDLFGKYGEDEQYKQIALAAVERLKGTKSLVEVNLGGMFKHGRGAYPADFLIRYMAQNGFEFILSSDAHCAEALGFAFDETAQRLKTLGVKSLRFFDGKEKKSLAL